MQNTHKRDQLQGTESNRNCCHLEEVTTSQTSSVRPTDESARNAGLRAAILAEVGANRRDLRRSTRRPFEALVRVYGSTPKGDAFYEDARTINVSMYGALLVMDASVAKGQKLLLFNEAIQRQQVCQIVDVRVGDAGSFEVAVSFPTPHAEFWNIFPIRHE
jgi:hypothetical protein